MTLFLWGLQCNVYSMSFHWVRAEHSGGSLVDGLLKALFVTGIEKS